MYNWEYPDHSHIHGHSCLVAFIWVHHLCDSQLVVLIGSAGNKCSCNTIPNEINAYPNPAYLKLRDFQDLCRHCHWKFSGEKSLSSNLYYHLCLWRENWSLLGENINYRYVAECCVLHKISIKFPQRKLERVILIYSYSSLTSKHLFNVFIYTYWAIQDWAVSEFSALDWSLTHDQTKTLGQCNWGFDQRALHDNHTILIFYD